MTESQRFTVSQVAKLTGATPAQLKNWDKQGVLRPERTGEGVSNNRKLYSQRDIECVQDILLFQELGLKLREIKGILDAPEELRRAKVVECSEALRNQYSQLRKRILLSSLAQTAGTDITRETVPLVGGYQALEDAYDQDENLKFLLRWGRSHSDREVQQLTEDLASVAEGFSEASLSSNWDEMELQVAHFCDLWGRNLGWPSVGQMLGLHWAFANAGHRTQEIDDLLGEGMTDFLSDIFLTAWVSGALDCLDGCLAFLYKGALEETRTEDLEEQASQSGEVLWAIVCELGMRQYLFSATPSEAVVEKQREVIDAVFDLLESAALDEDLRLYLKVNELGTIDGPGLETARQLTCAFIENREGHWLEEGGREQLLRRAAEWIDCLQLDWLQTVASELEDEDAMALEFEKWFTQWFDETYPEAPEARWTTEGESCEREKAMRELVEDTLMNDAVKRS